MAGTEPVLPVHQDRAFPTSFATAVRQEGHTDPLGDFPKLPHYAIGVTVTSRFGETRDTPR